MIWNATHKGDVKARKLADKHYTRKSPGHPMWTRPGYNFVLLAEYENGAGLFCWWRPKWEDGRPGTKRKDGLQVIECTMFRRSRKSKPGHCFRMAGWRDFPKRGGRADVWLDHPWCNVIEPSREPEQLEMF